MLPPFYTRIQIFFLLLYYYTPLIDGRVAGKVVYQNNYHSGRGNNINDELILISICMATIIAILITIALCYIFWEECIKDREYYVTI